MRRAFLTALCGLAFSWRGRAQHPVPSLRLTRCPVCHAAQQGKPVVLVVMGDGDAVDGSTLSYPVSVCLQCGVLSVAT